MRKILILIFWIFLSNNMIAQFNLIPNPSFEEYDTCPTILGFHFDGYVKNWKRRVNYPEYFNCNITSLNNIIPFDGGAVVGCSDYGKNNYERENFQVKLFKPIVKNRNYYIEFFISNWDPKENRRAGYGVNFTNKIQYSYIDSVVLTPVFYDTLIYGEYGRWQKIQGCFIPDSNYSVMEVGNFFSNKNTPVKGNNPNPSILSLYDAFYLCEIPDSLQIIIEKHELCEGDCIVLKSNMSLITGNFHWKTPGGHIEQWQDSIIEVCYNKAGEYEVFLNAENCAGQFQTKLSYKIRVVPRPEIINAKDTTIYIVEGNSAKVVSAYVGDNYQWMPNQFVECQDCEETSTIPITQDIDLFCIINGQSTCPDTSILRIKVVKAPIANFEIEKLHLCQGECVQITDSSKFADKEFVYYLTGPTIIAGKGTGLAHVCLDKPGVYSFFGIVKNIGTQDTFYIKNIQVFQRPTNMANLFQKFDVLQGDSLSLQSCSEGINYIWKSNHISCDTCRSVYWKSLQSEIVKVISYIDSKLCSDTCIYEINVKRLKAEIWVPNIFTPNGDGINDDFEVYGKFIELKKLEIYDKWGEQILSTSTNFRWNGTFKSQPLNPGVYTVIIQYIDLTSGITQYNITDVTLIK